MLDLFNDAKRQLFGYFLKVTAAITLDCHNDAKRQLFGYFLKVTFTAYDSGDDA